MVAGQRRQGDRRGPQRAELHHDVGVDVGAPEKQRPGGHRGGAVSRYDSSHGFTPPAGDVQLVEEAGGGSCSFSVIVPDLDRRVAHTLSITVSSSLAAMQMLDDLLQHYPGAVIAQDQRLRLLWRPKR